MTRRFAGRRAVITGASRGIGAALARRLAAEGADVVVAARTLESHDHLAGSLNQTLQTMSHFGGRYVPIVVDLVDAHDRQRLIPEAEAALGGPIDILVNNAAAAMYALPSTYSAKRRHITFEANVFAPHDLAMAAIPSMRERGEGWIVNVSSASKHTPPGPPYPTTGMGPLIGVYGASKAALDRLTQALAHELHGSGIRVNTIEPRAAVMSEGAEALVGGVVNAQQVESMEGMVESMLHVCDCPADFTGRVCVSLDLIDELKLTVRSLDGGPLTTG